MSARDIYNYLVVNDHLSTSGQPTAAQLAEAATEGFRVVVNLLPSDSGSARADKAQMAQALGLASYHLPVNWNEPTAQNFADFDQVMAQVGDRKTLLHCAANFRVTAFYALDARKHLGWAAEQAQAFRAPIWAGSDYPVWEAFIITQLAG
jgi:uncharacterized protein (TIGR01244 family)